MFVLRRSVIGLGREAIILPLCITLLLSAINGVSRAEESISAGLVPRISFEEQDHDFGNAVAGSILRHAFRFRNVGEKPLFIENVKAG